MAGRADAGRSSGWRPGVGANPGSCRASPARSTNGHGRARAPTRRGPLGRAVDPARVDEARARGLSTDDAARLSSLLSLLSDPVRVRILYALDLVDELCVGDLALALGVSEDAVGYGLRLLRTAGLVRTQKE